MHQSWPVRVNSFCLQFRTRRARFLLSRKSDAGGTTIQKHENKKYKHTRSGCETTPVCAKTPTFPESDRVVSGATTRVIRGQECDSGEGVNCEGWGGRGRKRRNRMAEKRTEREKERKGRKRKTSKRRGNRSRQKREGRWEIHMTTFTCKARNADTSRI